MQAPGPAAEHVLTRPSSYVCTIDGCGKIYAKESRLLEHQRTHTGEVRCWTLRLRSALLHALIQDVAPHTCVLLI